MKVLSSPLEAARETVPLEAPERARLRAVREETSPEAPPAIPSVEVELDPATRESLGRLAALIRGTEIAIEIDDEVHKEKKRNAEREQADLERRRKRNPDDADADIAEATRSSDALERLELCLAKENRKRGVKVYKKQKSQDVVQMILKELESREKKQSLDEDESESERKSA